MLEMLRVAHGSGRGMQSIQDTTHETRSGDSVVLALVQTADRLLATGHAQLSRWHNQLTRGDECDNKRGLVLYNTFIKQALNCMFKALRHFSATLDVTIQVFLYQKTATLLYNETASLNLASEYCSKGINLCRKNEPKLSVPKLKLQYLHFQIQFALNHSSSESLAYLNDVIHNEIPDERGFTDIKLFFLFTKFKYFSAIFSPEKNMLNLKTLLKSTNQKFRQMVLVSLIEYQLANNYIMEEIMTYVQLYDESIDEQSNVQFKAFRILIELQLTLHKVDLENMALTIKNLDTFINDIKQSKTVWNPNIMINLSQDTHWGSFPVSLTWLSFKEFTTISYFYCSILYSFKSWDGKNKSDKIFKMVKLSVNTSKKSTFTSIDNLQKHLIKTDYMKILIESYQLISDFVKDSIPLSVNSLSKYPTLQTFIDHYKQQESSFSSYEHIVYNSLIPLVKFILATIHQRNGNFQQALFLYSQIITSRQETSSFLSTTLNQIGVSVSNNEQLKLISTLNAVPLVQHALEQEKKIHSSISEFDINYDQTMKRFRDLLKLKHHLVTIINNSTIASQNELITLSIASIKQLHESIDQQFDFDSINLKKIENTSPLLAAILHLIKGFTYKFDLGLSTLDNLNNKVSCFNTACMYSIKACDDNNINQIARIGYLEIWKLMDHNRNLFSTKDIDRVTQKLNINSNGSTNKNKRVKFV